jgi:hypothetical protein
MRAAALLEAELLTAERIRAEVKLRLLDAMGWAVGDGA